MRPDENCFERLGIGTEPGYCCQQCHANEPHGGRPLVRRGAEVCCQARVVYREKRAAIELDLEAAMVRSVSEAA